MAQYPVRANLTSMAFPLLSDLSGRGIIMKQADQNYIASIQAKEDTTRDIGVPILYYCHNVISTSQGYQSIDYTQLVQAALVGSTNFVGVFSVAETAAAKRAYIGFDSLGKFYYSLDPYYFWAVLGDLPLLAGKEVFTAYVNGVTYIYFSGVGCYKFNFTSNTLDPVTLTGLTTSAILGITSVQGYLVAWTLDAIAWSSLTDPTDFTPSLVTGAGGGSVQGAEGNIVCCVPHTIGMVVYTTQNAVAAPTSGNARYPFNFRKLVASGGIAARSLITYDATSGNHYAYTTSGLQNISLQSTQSVFPEVTDFLAGSVFEDFNEISEEFEVTELATVMKKKFTLVSDRYLIISYGINEYTHALVHDIALGRWGKLRFTHVDVFEFSLLAAEIVETPRRSIALLAKDGSVHVVKIDARSQNSSGVLFLGKFQYIRSRFTSLHTLDLENVVAGAPLRVVDFYSTGGKDTSKKVGALLASDSLSRKYGFTVSGLNHSIMVKGSFSLVTVVLSVSNHGRR